VADISEEAIRSALEQTHGILNAAARRLGISSRTLRRKMIAASISYEAPAGPHERCAAELERELAVVPACAPLDKFREQAGEWGYNRRRQAVERMTDEEKAAFLKR
jgi:hypothetical protein